MISTGMWTAFLSRWREESYELEGTVGARGDSRWTFLRYPLVSTVGKGERELDPPFSAPQYGFVARFVIKAGVKMATPS